MRRHVSDGRWTILESASRWNGWCDPWKGAMSRASSSSTARRTSATSQPTCGTNTATCTWPVATNGFRPTCQWGWLSTAVVARVCDRDCSPSFLAAGDLDDPLLRFTTQLESDALDARTETVNLACLFHARGQSPTLWSTCACLPNVSHAGWRVLCTPLTWPPLRRGDRCSRAKLSGAASCSCRPTESIARSLLAADSWGLLAARRSTDCL